MKYRVILSLFTSISISLIQTSAHGESDQTLFYSLTTHQEPMQWINEHHKFLSANPNAVKELSREVLAESLRQGPQVFIRARPILTALLKIYPQPEITEALHPWPWSQGPWVDFVKNYTELNTQESPNPIYKQLDLCYRLNIRTCQADMLYRLGRGGRLLGTDSMASFLKGAPIAKSIGHQTLYLLNQIGLSAYGDDLDEDTEHYRNINLLQEQAKQNKWPEVEAIAKLYLARSLWDNDEAEFSEIIKVLESARRQFNQPTFQIEILMAQAKIEKENGQIASSRASWVNALALLPQTATRQRIEILQNLIASYLETPTQRENDTLQAQSALPYIEALLGIFPSDSIGHLGAQLQHIEALFLTGAPGLSAKLQPLQSQILGLPTKVYWQQQADLAGLLFRLGQPEKAHQIFDGLLNSSLFNERQLIKLMNQSQSIFGKDSARWALKLISSDAFLVRKTAVTQLNNLKPDFLLPEMKTMLHAEDAKIRSNMIQVIWHIQGQAALPDLLPLLQDSDAGVHENLLEALIQANYILPLNALEKELYSTHPNTRNKAFQMLTKHPEGKQKIIALAIENNSQLQEQALRQVGQLNLTEKEYQPFLSLLFSPQPLIKSSVSQLLHSKKPVSLWRPLVHLINQQAQPSHEAIEVLGQWKVPEALKQLTHWAKQSDQQKIAYAYLFAKTPMAGAEQQLLLDLLNKKETLAVRTMAMIGLLPAKQKTAWEHFSDLFKSPSPGNRLPSQNFVYQYPSAISLVPPCLPVSAIENAPIWLANYQENTFLLKHWWLKTPLLLWNGNQCVEPHLFSVKEKKGFKEKLQMLSAHHDLYIHKKAEQFIHALGSTSE